MNVATLPSSVSFMIWASLWIVRFHFNDACRKPWRCFQWHLWRNSRFITSIEIFVIGKNYNTFPLIEVVIAPPCGCTSSLSSSQSLRSSSLLTCLCGFWMFRLVSAKARKRAPYLFTGGIMINLDGRGDRHFLVIMSASTSAKGEVLSLKRLATVYAI